VVTRWATYVFFSRRTEIFLDLFKLSIIKTSLLPENDRTSVSLKEYLASIDVSMGGRVAEELSEALLAFFSRLPDTFQSMEVRTYPVGQARILGRQRTQREPWSR
jgi:hypothetical protein